MRTDEPALMLKSDPMSAGHPADAGMYLQTAATIATSSQWFAVVQVPLVGSCCE
jgi:hypothetical protein